MPALNTLENIKEKKKKKEARRKWSNIKNNFSLTALSLEAIHENVQSSSFIKKFACKAKKLFSFF